MSKPLNTILMKTNKVLWIPCAILFAVAVSCADRPNANTPVKATGAHSRVSYSPSGKGSGLITDYNFDGTEGDPIALANAKQWAANYRDKNPGGTEAHFFG